MRRPTPPVSPCPPPGPPADTAAGVPTAFAAADVGSEVLDRSSACGRGLPGHRQFRWPACRGREARRESRLPSARSTDGCDAGSSPTAPGPPAAPGTGCVGPGQRRDVLRSSRTHGEAVQMATIFRRQSADPRRPPTRHKAVVRMQRAQTREECVDDPQLIARPGHLVRLNLTSHRSRTGQETRVVGPGGRKPRGHVTTAGGESQSRPACPPGTSTPITRPSGRPTPTPGSASVRRLPRAPRHQPAAGSPHAAVPAAGKVPPGTMQGTGVFFGQSMMSGRFKSGRR